MMPRKLFSIIFLLGLFSCVTIEDINNTLRTWNGTSKDDLISAFGEPKKEVSDNQGNLHIGFRLRKIINPNASVDSSSGVILQRKTTGSRINKASAYGVSLLECNVVFSLNKSQVIYQGKIVDSELSHCDKLLKEAE